jgi:hypothetical protein
VTRLSSLFDVPAQLAMLLSLAASTAATEPSAGVAELAAPAAGVAILSEPLEGPLRFGERVWLRALHENTKEAETIGARVFVTSGGRYYMPSPNDRSRILAARNDTELAARVARAAADRNAARMRAALLRSPTAGDLYIAHVFGAETAIGLLKAASEAPNAALKDRFPALASSAAEASGDTKAPITVGQFYRRLSGALREPPRLVAIGLRPTIADAPRPDIAAEQEEGAKTIAWQTQVNLAKADRRAQ